MNDKLKIFLLNDWANNRYMPNNITQNKFSHVVKSIGGQINMLEYISQND